MAIPKLPLVSPATVTEAAEKHLRRWSVIDPPTDILTATSNGSLSSARLEAMRPYIAEPTLYQLTDGQSVIPWIGHKACAYVTTLGIMDDEYVVGVIDFRKISSIVTRRSWTIVAPTGVVIESETPHEAGLREWEEETRLIPDTFQKMNIETDPILPSRHCGMEATTCIATLRSPLRETERPRDKSEQLFLCLFSLNDWVSMALHGGFLEEATVVATQRAIRFHHGIRQAYIDLS